MALAFDIAGSIGMFRRPYTTTSSVSFPLPPPTTIAGLLAGIVGLKNNSQSEAGSAGYWEEMTGTKIALSVVNPILWHTGTLNFWNLKEPQKSPHIRVKHQFVKKPRYRVFVQGGLEKRLAQYLEKESFVYTPCLGTAYALADIKYLGSFEPEPFHGEQLVLNSVLPFTNPDGLRLDLLASKGLFRENLPFRLDEKRAFVESIPVLYAASPNNRLHLEQWEGLDVTQYGNEQIAWFPAW